MDEINDAYTRMQKNEVKYRFVLDLGSLNKNLIEFCLCITREKYEGEELIFFRKILIDLRKTIGKEWVGNTTANAFHVCLCLSAKTSMTLVLSKCTDAIKVSSSLGVRPHILQKLDEIGLL